MKLLKTVALLLSVGVPLRAQQPPPLTLQATALIRPVEAYRFWSHRVDFGVRWRPCYEQVCIQLGGQVILDNPLTIKDAGYVTQHFGAGIDVGTGKGWRVGVSGGQFLLTSAAASRPFDYYRFIAVGVEHIGPLFLHAESQVYQFDKSEQGPVIHQVRVVAQYEKASADVGYVRGAAPQRYGFLTGMLRIYFIGGFFGQAGTQAEPAFDGSFRHVRNSNFALGYQWSK